AFNDWLATEGLSPWSVTLLAKDQKAADAAAARLARLDSVDHTRTLSDYVPTDQEQKLAILEDVALFMAPPPPAERVPQAPSAAEELDSLRAFQAATAAMPPTLEPRTRAALDRLRTAIGGL